MKNSTEQEEKCLEIKQIIRSLRTKLFEIDNFKEYEKYSEILRKLSNKIDDIYWKL